MIIFNGEMVKLSRMVSRKGIVGFHAVLRFGRRFPFDSVGLLAEINSYLIVERLPSYTPTDFTKAKVFLPLSASVSRNLTSAED